MGNVVSTTYRTYCGCWMVMFVDGDYLRRAWCLLEIAVGTSTGSWLTVIGSCDLISGKDFYQNMDATMKEDVPKIKAEIIHIFSTVEKFNDIVAAAMQVLFLAAFTFCILCNK